MAKSKKNKQSKRTKRTKRIRLTRKKHPKGNSRTKLRLIKSQTVCNKKKWEKNGCAHNKYSESTCPLCRKELHGEVLQNEVHRGGSCSSCGLHQSGGRGGFYRPPAPIPGPFIGNAWGPSVRDWPGVDGIGADRNYLAKNLYHSDPQTMMLLGGRKKTNKKNGGGLIPQGLVNLGRDFTFNMGSAYNALNGYNAPVNPSPYMDQIPKSKSIII